MNMQERYSEKKEKKEGGLSTGWKALGAVTLGLLIGGKVHKLGPLGGGFDDKEMKDMEARGGWLKSVADQAAKVYTGLESLEGIADEHDFKQECKKWEEAIVGAESVEDKEKLEEEYNQMKRNRDSRLEKELAMRETRNKMFSELKEMVGW